MEENVALDTSKQKKFVKSIKGIKKLLKKKQLAQATEQQPEPISIKPKVKKAKKKKLVRGLVYLSHIPHGFYENQMSEYFKQFGTVTNVRVIRSKRTGRSKGHAFVEFKEPVVAEIVAETMNNYLMGKRLIKAAYIPPEKIRVHAMRKNWNTKHNPSAVKRLEQKKIINGYKTEEEDLKRARKILANLRKTKQKLSELGINYDFFTPVDIPAALNGIKEEKDKPEIKGDTVVKRKSKKKNKKTVVNNEAVNSDSEMNVIDTVKIESMQPKIEKKNKKSKKPNSQEIKVTIKVNQNNNKAKKGTVKPLEEFIKVQNDSNDDSSVEFDSDEFEKMLENESDYESSLENANELLSSDNEESVIDFPPEKNKEKPAMKVAKSATMNKKTKSKREKKKKSISPQIKRKASSTVPIVAIATKKARFEKQGNQLSTKKQFKKK